MEIRKAEIPCEKRKDIKTMDTKMNEQLTAIIHNTNIWVGLLFHECNGLLNNMNWLSKMFLEDPSLVHTLPGESFEELNRTTQDSIHSFRMIQNYLRVMKAVADKRNLPVDKLILNQAILLTSVPKLIDIQVEYHGLSLKVSRSFGKVLTFLLNQLLEIAVQAGLGKDQIAIAFNTQEDQALHVCVSGAVLFWHHKLWEQLFSTVDFSLRGDSSQWSIAMFYEMLALIDGKMIEGANEHKNFGDTIARPRLATELIQRTISAQHFTFSVPYALERLKL